MPRSIHSKRYAHFRALLKDTRRAAGMTQSALAAKLDRAQSYVAKYEQGERRLDVIEFLEITEAIGIDPSRLLKKLAR
jgi:transcriptional regulator with XRE-family HTH domain